MTKRNHKQINGQIISVISEHFNTLFLFLISPSVCTPDCVFVLLQDIQSQFEHCSCPTLKTRQMTHLNAGCFAGFSVWFTCPYRNDGTLKKAQTTHLLFRLLLLLECVEFSPRDFQAKQHLQLPPQQSSHQGMKSVCGKEMRALRK